MNGRSTWVPLRFTENAQKHWGVSAGGKPGRGRVSQLPLQPPVPAQLTPRAGSSGLGKVDPIAPVLFAIGGEKWAGVGMASLTGSGGEGGPPPLPTVEGMGWMAQTWLQFLGHVAALGKLFLNLTAAVVRNGLISNVHFLLFLGIIFYDDNLKLVALQCGVVFGSFHLHMYLL